MNPKIAVRRKPEGEELERKRIELRRLEAELADRELALTNLLSELAAFEGQYLRSVGALYAELDDINAQLAERTARQTGTAEDRQRATGARKQAEESQAAAHSDAAQAPAFTPTPDLKRLYREVAKKVHPDLASDPKDRAQRERLMAEANRAYQQGDAEALNRILDEYETSPESITEHGIGADLVRLIRRITQVRKRLAQIEIEIKGLTESELNQLRMKAADAAKAGRDLLAEMEASVRQRIEAAKTALAKAS